MTPISRMLPHAATTMMLQAHAPTRQLGLRSFFSGPPRLARPSDSMNRATRVPASTVVRMNSASNMIAKWYQNALRPVAAEDLVQHLGHAERQRRRAAGARRRSTPRRRSSAAAVISSPVIGAPDRPRPLT